MALHGVPRAWLRAHLQAMFFSLGHLWRNRWSTLISLAVIASALTLPAGLQVILGQFGGIGAGLPRSAHITVFLRQETPEETARNLAETLQQDERVAATWLVTPEEALAEFRALSGFGDALEGLEGNPLPAVITLDLASRAADSEAAEALAAELQSRPQVELVQVDTLWLRRLGAILDLVQRGVLVGGALLACAVLLVVGNTVRMDIQNRREEIAIAKLVGATEAFVRRPFLYGGFWLGLMGGLLAALVLAGAVQLMSAPVAVLTELYGSSVGLHGPGAGQILGLVGVAGLLGLAGSWVAVGLHLRSIEPA